MVADCEIEALGNHIDHLIAEAQIELKLGKVDGQLQQHRHRAMTTEQCGHRDAQPPGHFAPPGLELSRTCPQFGDRTQAALMVNQPVLGEAQPARRAVEEPDAQPHLHARDGLTDRRPRQRQTFRRPREASRLRDFDEHRNAVEIVSYAFAHCRSFGYAEGQNCPINLAAPSSESFDLAIKHMMETTATCTMSPLDAVGWHDDVQEI
ncbi:hypothetical protein GCM10007301_33550 [Azorhizobium oxalatiphilum]|uniref:Uncharacterized protein n=1 Tax=Azorhizobium oxalatiphilum TaxID=980631 RepID=A0A917C4A3_9HYPH|nr:hypothetical protein GCM10007301_33550 [Azorhizobium oxalatiphilum]